MFYVTVNEDKSLEMQFTSLNEVNDYVNNVIMKIKNLKGWVTEYSDNGNEVSHPYMFCTYDYIN